MAARAYFIPQQVPHTCWICGQTVKLEICKIDEHGLAVHERCQTLKLAAQNGKAPANETRPRR